SPSSAMAASSSPSLLVSLTSPHRTSGADRFTTVPASSGPGLPHARLPGARHHGGRRVTAAPTAPPAPAAPAAPPPPTAAPRQLRWLLRLPRPAVTAWAAFTVLAAVALLWLGGPLTSDAAAAWKDYRACAFDERCAYDQDAILAQKDLYRLTTYALLTVPLLVAAWAGGADRPRGGVGHRPPRLDPGRVPGPLAGRPAHPARPAGHRLDRAARRTAPLGVDRGRRPRRHRQALVRRRHLLRGRTPPRGPGPGRTGRRGPRRTAPGPLPARPGRGRRRPGRTVDRPAPRPAAPVALGHPGQRPGRG